MVIAKIEINSSTIEIRQSASSRENLSGRKLVTYDTPRPQEIGEIFLLNADGKFEKIESLSDLQGRLRLNKDDIKKNIVDFSALIAAYNDRGAIIDSAKNFEFLIEEVGFNPAGLEPRVEEGNLIFHTFLGSLHQSCIRILKFEVNPVDLSFTEAVVFQTGEDC